MREGEKSIVTRIIYDSDGLPVSELQQHCSIEYLYDDNHNPITIRKRDKKGQILEDVQMSYEGENLVSKEKTDSTGALREKRDYRNNKDNKTVLEICGSRQIRYEYKGDFIEKEFRYYGKEPELALLYKRNTEGRIINIQTIDYKGNNLRTEDYTWKDGLLESLIVKNKEGKVLRDEGFVYDCFHEGNWLKRTRFNRESGENREAVEVIYRSIAYSDNIPEIKPVHIQEPHILKEEKQSLSFRDGSLYRGDISNGQMEGKGYIQWPDGSSYKGEFHQNRMEGEGLLTWANGDIYSGTFRQGKMEGVGRLRWAGGKTFYGLFEDNRRTNQGIIEEDQ